MAEERQHIRQAVILVGGKGTRLGQLTGATPKPLLEVAPGLPFLDVVIENVARQGFTKVLLIAGHLGGQIEARYHGKTIRGAHVAVLREPSPAGTGGALVLAQERLDPWFLLCNGDTFFDINLRAFVAQPPQQALGKIALRRIVDPARYGSVELDEGRITAFGEKRAGNQRTGLISTGIYRLHRDAVGALAAASSLEIDLFPRLAAQGQLTGEVFDGYFLDMGLPETFAQAMREVPGRRRRAAAFLDRDGVLNRDVGHAHRPDQLQWIPGAQRAVRHLNDAGYYVFVVTNQAGVAKGFYGEADVHAFHDHMQRDLAAAGAYIDALYYCPFHPDAATPKYRAAAHPDRKPAPGMILRALHEWPIDVDRSFLIGDHDTDIAAARAAGIRGVLFDGGNLHAAVRAAASDGSRLRHAAEAPV